MRLFNPEWEAIKEFQHAAGVRDAVFDLDGRDIPEDHGQLLFEALLPHLPWLVDVPEAGILPIHGASSGTGTLVINRRARLILRLPLSRLEATRVLVGKHINLGPSALRIGDLKEKPLTPFHYLYSPCVVFGGRDEAPFLEAVTAHLQKQGIQGGLIPGKPRKMRTPDGDAYGFSLMLHDVSLAQSVQIQEQGIGRYRNLGCGIFVPHKSIKEVAGN
ncbi:MAG: type I-MYXAN CRISPR-associated protein Cas6/Cmx6 [Bacteroidales bacterium]|nr:type I-MYXAN CRISPR-associated protein Cas6/Cmx6 [Bacteroidales bacterium]